MKIIEPSVELMRDFDGAEIMKFIERSVAWRREKRAKEKREKLKASLLKE